MRRFFWTTAMLACSATIGFCDLEPVPTTIFSDPLPTANVNGENGATRSNFAFTETGGSDPLQQTAIDGGSFTLNSSTNSSYVITSLSTYSVASLCAGGDPCTATSQAQPLGDEFESVMLAVRPVSTDPISGALIYGNWNVLDQGTLNTSFNSPTSSVVGNSNPNITDTNVKYSNGQNYEGDGAPGSYYPLWQTTFNNLNLPVQTGVQYQFVVWGFGWDQACNTIDFQCMDPNTSYGYWYNEYSDPFNSGQIEQGATGSYLSYVNFMNTQLCPTLSACQGLAPQQIVGNTVEGTLPVNQNVIIQGYGVNAASVPEPATGALAGLGLVLVGCLSRKWRK